MSTICFCFLPSSLRCVIKDGKVKIGLQSLLEKVLTGVASLTRNALSDEIISTPPPILISSLNLRCRWRSTPWLSMFEINQPCTYVLHSRFWWCDGTLFRWSWFSFMQKALRSVCKSPFLFLLTFTIEATLHTSDLVPRLQSPSSKIVLLLPTVVR